VTDLRSEWEAAFGRIYRKTFAELAHIPSRILNLRERGELRNTRAVQEVLGAVRAGKRTVLLLGRPGTGKSVAAAEVLLAPVHRLQDGGPHFVGEWITAREYCEASYDHDQRGRVRDVQRALYLVVDDLGLEQPHDRQRIEGLISSRYDDDAQVTLLTTNLTGLEFQEAYGPRVLSRLREVGAVVACSEVVRPGERQNAPSGAEERS